MVGEPAYPPRVIRLQAERGLSHALFLILHGFGGLIPEMWRELGREESVAVFCGWARGHHSAGLIEGLAPSRSMGGRWSATGELDCAWPCRVWARRTWTNISPSFLNFSVGPLLFLLCLHIFFYFFLSSHGESPRWDPSVCMRVGQVPILLDLQYFPQFCGQMFGNVCFPKAAIHLSLSAANIHSVLTICTTKSEQARSNMYRSHLRAHQSLHK